MPTFFSLLVCMLIIAGDIRGNGVLMNLLRHHDIVQSINNVSLPSFDWGFAVQGDHCLTKRSFMAERQNGMLFGN